MGADPVAPIAVESSPIQGGTADTTDLFAVGIVQTEDIENDMVAYCTGVALAPNLVATARHCVAELSSPTIDCGTSTFGALYPVSDVVVTTSAVIDPHELKNTTIFNTVSTIIVPTGANQTAVCGNDIALLILNESLQLPQYVLPTISPPMTDSQYETIVTAIGYGVDTPTDTTGESAGTRRIKENVSLQCIPDDPNPSEAALDCYSPDPAPADMYLSTSEFMSGDSTCEGDSGSGAFEQSNFNNGKWVAFGVLSRGGTSSDGTTCVQPIYSRFDAWASLLIGAAKQAASLGGYPLPAWAEDSSTSTSTVTTTSPDAGAGSSSGGASTLGEGDAGGSAGSSGGSTATSTGGSSGSGPPASAPCDAAGDCLSVTSSTPHESAGCSVAMPPSPARPWPGSALALGAGLVGMGLGRRRRRKR